LLDADTTRVGTVEAAGVDDVLFARKGRWRTQQWSTPIVDVGSGQLLDVIEGRSSAGLCAWLAAMPAGLRDAICWAVWDLSGPRRLAFDTMLPDAGQVADPFHPTKLANEQLNEVRRPVQNQTLGHRGRKDDPPLPIAQSCRRRALPVAPSTTREAVRAARHHHRDACRPGW
jgi:transposase